MQNGGGKHHIVEFATACPSAGAGYVLDLSKQKVSGKQTTRGRISKETELKKKIPEELLSAEPPESLQVSVLPAKKMTARNVIRGWRRPGQTWNRPKRPL